MPCCPEQNRKRKEGVGDRAEIVVVRQEVAHVGCVPFDFETADLILSTSNLLMKQAAEGRHFFL